MEYNFITASDGCRLAYASTSRTNSHQPNTCILLMHGFSGSSAYFKHNTTALASQFWVVAPDMRGHGRSDLTPGGYHVARLAADLRELILHLRGQQSSNDIRFFPVGCSIGAAVLWTYAELFGDKDFAGLIFVDQAPLQNRSPRGDWNETKAHTGCYDLQTILAAQHAWATDRVNAQKGLIEGCLGYYHPDYPGSKPSQDRQKADFEFFNAISSQCPSGEWLGLLIADHTAYDHREALELVRVPTLVIMGRYSGCFPLEGMRESVRRINGGSQARGGQPLAKESVYECGHWLFYEDAERFNKEVLEFVASLGA
ncbi:AB hydrolase superfamily protein YdjP [Cyphellophora attinorum]|uniref:AB hydrolase superfamily protein YdjP n=1 Tax=Cyphellophora attinorum TaxID=1664694 RepID=A0A0N1H5K2_9EURO|nr:AB hydrolase superfamily protein YdjP [Phialophora attinorum]KPI37695.1 AB hydrolase superfamily protein YdjP [Phialophora attinorum]